MVNDSSFDLHYNLIYCCLINLVFFGLLSPDFFFLKKKGERKTQISNQIKFIIISSTQMKLTRAHSKNRKQSLQTPATYLSKLS